MLKSLKHTKNWKIQLAYFDVYNSSHPKTINHVSVKTNDGESQYILVLFEIFSMFLKFLCRSSFRLSHRMH